MRLCVYLVPLCDFAHFDCSTLYFVNNPRHSTRYCASVIRLLKSISKFLCYFNLWDTIKQITRCNKSIFFTKCGLVYDFNPVRAEQII